MAPPRKADPLTKIFSIRATPTVAQRATELARQRGMARSTLFIELFMRELAAADCSKPTDPAKEEVNAAKQI